MLTGDCGMQPRSFMIKNTIQLTLTMVFIVWMLNLLIILQILIQLWFSSPIFYKNWENWTWYLCLVWMYDDGTMNNSFAHSIFAIPLIKDPWGQQSELLKFFVSCIKTKDNRKNVVLRQNLLWQLNDFWHKVYFE